MKPSQKVLDTAAELVAAGFVVTVTPIAGGILDAQWSGWKRSVGWLTIDNAAHNVALAIIQDARSIGIRAGQ